MPKIVQISHLKEMYTVVRQHQAKGKTVGVVPTMGALHAGHMSLVKTAREKCDVVVTTIFVNPTQFSPNEDLDQYPRPLENDLKLLEEEGVELAFCPDHHDMYPPGYSTYVEPPAVAKRFEGAARSSHFRGVATIVLKLFQIVPADVAFFGQKDYQQALLIQKMVVDFNLPIEICVEPIVREPDGLAMSSRNIYLNETDRQRATTLSHTLFQVEQQIALARTESDFSLQQVNQILTEARSQLACTVDRLDYLELADASDLSPINSATENGVLLVAAHVGQTRLIDNQLIELSPHPG